MTTFPSTNSGPDYGVTPFSNDATRRDLPTNADAGRTNFRTSVIQLDRPGDSSVFDDTTRAEAAQIIARYPAGQARSALLPMLHLVQSVQGQITPDGIAFCAEQLELTKAQVSAVATFYTMYKRTPTGEYLVSVCTNTLCAFLGGDEIFATLKEILGIGNNETTADGSITLEHAECLAACDYAPVVTVDYEFYDQQDVESARELVAALRRGEKPAPDRGAPLTDFKGISRQLAGFSQYADSSAAAAAIDAPGALGPTLVGLRLAEQRGEAAPAMPRAATSASSSSGAAAAEAAGVESAQRGAPEPAGRRLSDGREGTDTPAGAEPGTSGQGPGKA
jgi:NADH-quinone oxidoreductase subunit E